MGCFNFKGAASRLPILYRDDIVAFICIVNRRVDIESTVDELMSFNRVYIPIALPIYGKYNDYGSIENIMYDQNVKNLENLLGDNIENIIKILDIPHNKENKEKYQKYLTNLGLFEESEIFITLEHKEFFDTIIKFGNYWNMSLSYDISKEIKDVYDDYGFIKDEYDKKYPNMYTKNFQMSSSDNQENKQLCLNVNPQFEYGFFEYPSEMTHILFLWVYRKFPELIWNKNLKNSYCNMLMFWFGLFNLEMEFYPSRYMRQDNPDTQLVNVLKTKMNILQKHIEKNK